MPQQSSVAQIGEYYKQLLELPKEKREKAKVSKKSRHLAR